jgi:hypothetical protein
MNPEDGSLMSHEDGSWKDVNLGAILLLLEVPTKSNI